MSKGLKEIENPYKAIYEFDDKLQKARYYYTKEQVEIIEKELKALKIIKKKNVNVHRLLMSSNIYHYNNYYEKDPYMQLTQEEYDLLKEALL